LEKGVLSVVNPGEVRLTTASASALAAEGMADLESLGPVR
jgi:hypothetical protein